MKIFGISVVTIVLVVGALYVGKKWGGSIPLLNSIP